MVRGTPKAALTPGARRKAGRPAPANPNRTLRERLADMRIPHWLHDTEISFMQRVIMRYARLRMVPQPLLTLLQPSNACVAFDSMLIGARGRDCCETSIHRTGDFNEPVFRNTYLQYDIQNVHGNHWVGTAYRFAEGEPTTGASRTVGIDSLAPESSRAPLLTKSHTKMAKRGHSMSFTDTEPPHNLDLMMGVPLVTRQEDGISCGAFQLAWSYLAATQQCDPFLPDEDPRSISRYDLPTGAPLYDWLARVVEWLGLDL